MKKTLLCLIAGAIFLASCSTVKYTNKIEGRTISQQGHFVPISDSLTSLLNSGWVSAVNVHDGVYEVFDSVYILSPRWSQVRAYDRQNHSCVEFWAGTGILSSTIGSYVILTSIGIGAAEFTLVPMAGIYIGGSLIGGSSEWYRANGAREILKTDYVNNYSKSDSAKAKFWYTTVVSY